MAEAYKAMTGVEEVQHKFAPAAPKQETFNAIRGRYLSNHEQAELQDSLPRGFMGMWSSAGSTTPVAINQNNTGVCQD